MNCELCHTQYVRGILTTTKRTIHHLTIVFDKGCPKKNLAVFLKMFKRGGRGWSNLDLQVQTDVKKAANS